MYTIEDPTDLLLEDLKGDENDESSDGDVLGEEDEDEKKLGSEGAWEIEGDLEQE